MKGDTSKEAVQVLPQDTDLGVKHRDKIRLKLKLISIAVAGLHVHDLRRYCIPSSVTACALCIPLLYLPLSSAGKLGSDRQ